MDRTTARRHLRDGIADEHPEGVDGQDGAIPLQNLQHVGSRIIARDCRHTRWRGHLEATDLPGYERPGVDVHQRIEFRAGLRRQRWVHGHRRVGNDPPAISADASRANGRDDRHRRHDHTELPDVRAEHVWPSLLADYGCRLDRLRVEA